MIILASNSPIRAKLLQKFGISFIQKPLDFDEDSLQTTIPQNFAYLATMGKYKKALQNFGYQTPILAADTVVSVAGILQRKAKNKIQAQSYLESQSNQTIEIITCMMYRTTKLEFIDISSTRYQLKNFDKKHLHNYLASKEWMGKAGCVMIEGFHKSYIKSQTGLESTALGLSIEKILPFLEII
ncbi:septum formation inhibitor Maf [Helicobacter sp. 11S03491-1]|uniref:septum formation inhibitor Maf n=1 Tax=Helicobacter sp. 11S03491-1 TaxID=1476196 RepID=UPI000BA62B4F|nr:septum formation inhibitor Maf [Helicobacter sp. 11S03491-1]PAF42974.1 hypothetical protein BKH45_02580 [Helicobacter sp. 11S03491-1]